MGDIIYNVEGLPEGAFLQGDNIFVKDSANSGNFVLRIKAIDSENSIANQIITLIINNDDAEAQIVSDA